MTFLFLKNQRILKDFACHVLSFWMQFGFSLKVSFSLGVYVSKGARLLSGVDLMTQTIFKNFTTGPDAVCKLLTQCAV